LRSPQKLTANILDLAHHGSNTSSVIDFIKAVQPTRALASAHKNNPYNHPHGEVLARLNDLKIPLQVTGESGDIAYLLDTRSFLSSLFL
jgi:competence protein ComEC